MKTTMHTPEQFIILYGNPADGFNHVGPFKSRDAAIHYTSDDHPANWWIIMLDAPALIEDEEQT